MLASLSPDMHVHMYIHIRESVGCVLSTIHLYMHIIFSGQRREESVSLFSTADYDF